MQIIDDFHVVNCKDPKAVIGYLSLMTQYLRSLYAGKTLHAVPHATFTSGAKLSLDDPAQHLITFDELGRVAEKNKVYGGQMLMLKILLHYLQPNIKIASFSKIAKKIFCLKN